MIIRWLVAALCLGAVAEAEPIAFEPPCPKDYPEEALEAGHQGSVSLIFTITAYGTVANPTVAVSSGYPELDERALACVRSLHYRPATHDGQPVAVTWNTEMHYVLPPPEQIPLLKAVNHAIAAVKDEASRCLVASDAAKIVRADFAGFTRLAITVAPDKEPTVTVSASSGNPSLDSVATDCFRKAPSWTAVGSAIPKERTFVMNVPWVAVLHAR